MLASAIDAMMRKEPLGAQPSALKLACSSVAQSLSRIAMLAVGPAGTQQFLRDDATVSSAGLWVSKDRKSAVEGKRWSVSVEFGGCRIFKNKNKNRNRQD